MKSQTTLTLSKNEISEAIGEWLKKRGVKIKGGVDYLYGTRTEGFGQMEHDSIYFDGATVDVVGPDVARSRKTRRILL